MNIYYIKSPKNKKIDKKLNSNIKLFLLWLFTKHIKNLIFILFSINLIIY